MGEGRWTRRAVVIGALGLGGCAVTDPVIYPTDAVRTPARPTISPEQAASLAGELQLTAALSAASTLQTDAKAWATAQLDARHQHALRLRAIDPLLPGEQPDVDTPTATPGGPMALAKVAAAALDQHRSRALALAGREQPLALFYASLAASAHSCTAPGVAPVAGTGAPRPFAPATPTAVYPIVLTRCWALIYGLESGLGRLDAKSARYAEGLARLADAKQLRDDLLARPDLAHPPTQLANYDLGGPVTTEAEALAAWGRLELALLGAWGRLAAASTGDAAAYALDAMIGQAGRVQQWGAPLPYWPGWV